MEDPLNFHACRSSLIFHASDMSSMPQRKAIQHSHKYMHRERPTLNEMWRALPRLFGVFPGPLAHRHPRVEWLTADRSVHIIYFYIDSLKQNAS